MSRLMDQYCYLTLVDFIVVTQYLQQVTDSFLRFVQKHFGVIGSNMSSIINSGVKIIGILKSQYY